MNKIALFIRSLSKGGAEKQSILLSEFLSEYYPVYLIVYTKKNISLEIEKPNYEVIFLEGNIIKKTIRLISVLKSNKITHLFNFLPLNNIMGITGGKIAGVKYLYGGIRGVKYKSKMKMLLMRLMCNRISTGFISNSYAAADSYTKYGFRTDKVSVIHNAIEKSEKQKAVSKNEKCIILSVGRFVSEKDYHTTIKAIKYLTEHFDFEATDSFLFKIIGYGSLEQEIRQIISKNDLGSVIDLKTDGKIGDSYQEADIFLNTSEFEGMPNVVMEAMNCSLPVIATDAGDTGYLIKNGINGFLHNAKDYRALAHSLYKLIINPAQRITMGEESLKIIENSFRPEKAFNAYIDLIEDNE